MRQWTACVRSLTHPYNGGVIVDEPFLIYDGDCGFCSASASWIARKWRGPNKATVVPWQQLSSSRLDELELSTDDVTCAAWWVEGGNKFRGHLAVAHSLLAAGRGWRVVGRFLLLRWVQRPAAFGYQIVVRNRYRFPGGSEACRF
jgi:predicted DCC family thiol-disulfide oxidoreductase YuxK